jgi:Fe2+-dicitrate sensor, membrane component
MKKELKKIEDLLTEESILSWYFQSDPAAVNYWNNWSGKSAGNAALLDEVKKILQSLKFKNEQISELSINESWQKLLNKIAEREKPDELKMLSKPRKNASFYLSIAAAAMITVIVGLFWLNKQVDNNKLKTNYGQIKQQLLPDSSLVILNANSNIVTKDFQAGKDREVWLEGEAYFKVHKTISKDKFIVHTNKIDIVVTGTQFNVYSRDNKTRVYLKEGSILVKSKTGDNWVKMKPGDYLVLDNDQLTPVKETTADKTILDWQNKQMIFDNTPLEEVAHRISEVYGIEVNISDDIKNEPITGIMPNDNLSVLLKTFEVSQEFNITQTPQKIIISKK